MSLEADINWIKSEIDKLEDPFLIEAFKNLLNYRKQNTVNKKIDLEEILINRALNSEDDIAKGRLLSRKDMDNRTK